MVEAELRRPPPQPDAEPDRRRRRRGGGGGGRRRRGAVVKYIYDSGVPILGCTAQHQQTTGQVRTCRGVFSYLYISVLPVRILEHAQLSGKAAP